VVKKPPEVNRYDLKKKKKNTPNPKNYENVVDLGLGHRVEAEIKPSAEARSQERMLNLDNLPKAMDRTS